MIALDRRCSGIVLFEAIASGASALGFVGAGDAWVDVALGTATSGDDLVGAIGRLIAALKSTHVRLAATTRGGFGRIIVHARVSMALNRFLGPA